MDITTIRLPASNAHLVRGQGGTILVDAGTRAAVPILRKALARLGVDLASLAAVVLTHGHADHAGGARLLVGPNIPILVGAPDAALVQAGHNPPLVPTNLTARGIRPFVDRPFTAYQPDIEIGDRFDLTRFGLDADAVVVGGHTPGSLVVVAHRPGAPALVGDLVRGGHMGGAVRPGRALRSYYSADTDRDLALLRTLLERHQPTRLYVGHGGPLPVRSAAALAASAGSTTRRSRARASVEREDESAPGRR
jgi:glyoxylase-like metal-dependent hydrolase (beta-lactamase superfamily II)